MAINQVQREMQLQFHPEQIKAFENIETLIEEVRRCREPIQYRTVQQHLGEYIEHADNTAEEASSRLKLIETHLRRLPYNKNVIDRQSAQKKLEQDKEQADLERERYRRLGRQYRSIGDAMAWQLYGFRALPIYALGLNASPGPISQSKKRGADAEAKKVDELWDEYQAFALRHDYTNLLRVWDLSIFYPDDINLAYIMEVKAEDGEVEPKQKKIGQIVSDLVGKNEFIRPDGELFVHRKLVSHASDGAIKTNMSLLWQALIQSKKEAIGHAANSYLSVTVGDLTNSAKLPDDQLVRTWKEKTEEILFPHTWPIYCIDELRSDSKFRLSKPSFGAPYTIFPIASDYAAAIVTGFIKIHYRLNTNAITRSLRDAGLEAKCFLGDYRNPGGQLLDSKRSAYFQVQRGAITLNIHALPVEQLLFEGLPLEDLVASVISQCEAEEKQREKSPNYGKQNVRRFHSMSTYTSMEAVWATSLAYIFSEL